MAVKADGLAAGKGVVMCSGEAEARRALEACLLARDFGPAGATALVEETLTGPEVSLLALADGARVVGLPAARDYKRIGDGDRGPNTGGMGAVSPVPDVPAELADRLIDEVHRPVVAEMARRGTPFRGVLYAGLMLTADGPRVLEFNVRFGDPEAQAVLPRLDDDLLGLLAAAAAGRLPEAPPRPSPEACVAVVLAAAGYPAAPRAGDPIEGLDEAAALGAEVYHAGTALDAAGRTVTAGGRVLAVSARGEGIGEARARAYAAAERVRFDGPPDARRHRRRARRAGDGPRRVIARYSRPEMAAVWTEEAKLARWLEVELAVCRAWAARGVIPAGDLAQIESRAGFSVERTREIERVTDHDVVAFLTDVAERVGPASRWIHYGMTSSDVLDTGLALAIARAGALLLDGQAALTRALRDRALEHAGTLEVGRTHGVHAEPTTFGLKLAGFAFESRRNEERLRAALEGASVGKLSGAVGTYATLDPDLEAEVLAALGLGVEPASTQVVARDRHAALVAQMAVAASSLDRLATELRHLQRTEVREAEEAFAAGQKGSSAMPHKRNPITAERISGLARVIRGHAVAALEDVALWHERDISHSSVERIVLPDGFGLLDYLLHRTRALIEGLVVHPERMLANLGASGGLVYSQRVLLSLVERGLTREDAYALVQRAAMTAWDEGRPLRDVLAPTRRWPPACPRPSSTPCSTRPGTRGTSAR